MVSKKLYVFTTGVERQSTSANDSAYFSGDVNKFEDSAMSPDEPLGCSSGVGHVIENPSHVTGEILSWNVIS